MATLEAILASYKKPVDLAGNGNGVHPSTAPLPSESNSLREDRQAWQKLIDEKLIEWGRHPEQFEDEDGYKAPSADNLVRATEFIGFCRNHGVAPPLRMVPDGEGGIVFDWKNNPPFHVTMEIHPDGGMEMIVFHECKLVARERIGTEAPV